jgi:hypothetical protein
LFCRQKIRSEKNQIGNRQSAIANFVNALGFGFSVRLCARSWKLQMVGPGKSVRGESSAAFTAKWLIWPARGELPEIGGAMIVGLEMSGTWLFNSQGTSRALYRIYRELSSGKWFVEGNYD